MNYLQIGKYVRMEKNHLILIHENNLIMYVSITKAKPIENFKLELTFENGEVKLFDVKPFMDKGIFRELYDIELFETVRKSFDAIEWENEADIDPEVLYDNSIKKE